MKKIIPLIFSVFYVANLNAQAVGGWGTCEFTTVATMNAFDPSTNAYDCKKVFVQATNEHYYWNGTIWVLVTDTDTDDQTAAEVPFTPTGTISSTNVQTAIAEVAAESLDNIYNTDGTLTSNRAVTQNNFDLNFDANTLVIDGSSNRVGIGTTSPDAKLDVDGGQVRFSDYGTPTTYDDASPLKILGVQTDGDIVQTTLASIVGTDDQTATEVNITDTGGNFTSTNVEGALSELASATPDNIYTTNGTLDANRTITMDGNDITFDGTLDVFIGDNGKIGAGTTSPGAQIEAQINRNQNFTIAQPDDGVNSFLSALAGINTNSANWSRAVTALTPNIPDGSTSGLITFGQGDAFRQAGHMYFVDTGSDGDEYIGFGIRNGSANILNMTGDGDVGIGTTSPDAKLDVDGGQVRFSDYGSPTTYDDASPLKILGVQSDGDIVQTGLSSIVGTDDQIASEVNITDLGGNFTATNVEGALAELASTTDNSIYNANGTLTGNRTVNMGINDLTFNSGTNSNFLIDGFSGSNFNNPIFQLDRNNNRDLRFFHENDNNSGYWKIGTNDGIALELDNTIGKGVYLDSSGDFGVGTDSPDRKLDVDGGQVRFSDYGTPTTYDDASPLKILGVQADGDIVQTTLSSIVGTDDQTASEVSITDTGGNFTSTNVEGALAELASSSGGNIYTTNGTLTGDREVTMGNNDLEFNSNGSGDFIVSNSGTAVLAVEADNVGIGLDNPDETLHIFETTGTPASATGGTIFIEKGNSGGSQSIVFESRRNQGSDYGYIEYSDDGSGNGSSSENSLLTIGVENDESTDGDQDDIAILPSGALGIGTTSPDAFLDVDGGQVRFSDYGTPTTYDDASPLKILGVQADGDVVQIATSSLGGNNIYNTNGTLTGDREVTMGNNDLEFNSNGSGDFIVSNSGTAVLAVEADNVGIGLDNPDETLHIFETTGTPASATGGTIFIEKGNSGGSQSIVFESRRNQGSDYGYIEYSDDGSGNGSSSENSLLTIGVENDESTDGDQDDIAILPSGALGIGTTSPDAFLDVDGGQVRFSDYGTPTTYDDASPLKILGVQADGDVVQTTLASIVGTDDQTASEVNITDSGGNFTSNNVEGALAELAASSGDNIYTTNGTLTGNRAVTQNNFDINFDANTLVIDGSADRVGIGTSSPLLPLDVRGAIGVNRNEISGGFRSWMTDGLLTGAGSSDNAYFGLKDEGSNAADAVIAWGDDSGDDLRFINTLAGGSTDGSEYMRILGGSGFVGIGTPSPQAILDVDGGQVRFSDYGTGTYDDASPARILGVQADGDIIEVDPSTLGGGTTTAAAVGTIYIADGDEVETTLDTDTPKKASGVTTLINANNVDMPANNRLRYTGSGTQTFFVSCNVSTRVDGNQKQIYYTIRKNGAVIPSITSATHFTQQNSDNERNATTVTGTVELSTNDYIELWVEHVGDNEDITIWFMNMTMMSVNGGGGSGSGGGSGDNIYTANGTLGADRTVTMGGNDLTFNGSVDMIIQDDGDVGIGTTSPATRLEVAGGGVRFSDYGSGVYEDTTAVYLLGVEADGDVIEMNTAKSSRVFYPPAIAINASAEVTNATLDLHQQYLDLFEDPAIKSSGAPGEIPSYSETELYYYITDYDTNIFDNITINASGVMQYNVIDVPEDNCSFINVVFVVKEP